MAQDTYFKITPPDGENARAWARQKWDTYCFDYDTERLGDTVLAWNDGCSVDELKAALDADGIEYETFEADINKMFDVEGLL